MTTSYRTVFNLPPKTAVQMARVTKGYPFAFQILGYLKWEHNASLEEILPEFDEALASYAYEKIWSELSDLDRKIVYVISTGLEKTIDIRTKLSLSPAASQRLPQTLDGAWNRRWLCAESPDTGSAEIWGVY